MIKKVVNLFSEIKMTIISAICLILSFVCMIFDFKPVFNPAIITIIISGTPIVYKAFYKLIYQRFLSSPFLITIAMIASISIGELIAAGEVALIMVIGELLEHKTIEKTKKGVERLFELTPKVARKIYKNNDKILPISQIKINDTIRVLPGETIPVDGKIISGSSSINQSTLTGEALPVDKTIGDTVMAGTINCFGCIDIKVEKIKDTYLQKMIDLVQHAETRKAPTQKIVDKWARILIPSALALSLLVYFFTGEIIRAVTILVVFCPCALILATPTSIIAAIGHGAKNGVLIKSGEALEEMGKVDTIVFDKTGTLTHGNIIVSNVITSDNIIKEDFLRITASLEKYSEHTLAKSIVNYVEKQKIKLTPATNLKIIPGKGVTGSIAKNKFYVGSLDFISKEGIDIPNNIKKEIKKYINQGKAIVITGNKNTVLGFIALTDKIRENSISVIQNLKKLNIGSIILSGDNQNAVKYFAQKLDITEVIGNLLPVDKVNKIEELKQKGKIVCMVGDGINDAPALKIANVGIAMGNIGTDIAIDSADISLINDNIESIPYLKKLSLATISTIKTNISISMGLNILGISLSMLGILTPMTGAIMHNLGSVIVVLNAARIYKRKI